MLKKLTIVLFLCFFSAMSFAGEKININTATVEQLQSLDGIGAKTAMAIIEYRETVGAFKQVSQLTEVKGIGEKKLAGISDDISVELPVEKEM